MFRDSDDLVGMSFFWAAFSKEILLWGGWLKMREKELSDFYRGGRHLQILHFEASLPLPNTLFLPCSQAQASLEELVAELRLRNEE